jgi:hypothetical protein
MACHTEPKSDAAARKAAGPTDPNQAVARDRKALRTEDLNKEEIAAVKASELAPGFEHLDAETDPAGGGRCWRRLRPKTSGARRCRQGTAGR